MSIRRATLAGCRNQQRPPADCPPPQYASRMSESQQTPLHDWHVARGGRMVDFAGWRMPVQYEGVVAEHTAVRTACGLFDVSHMGRALFTGAGAGRHLHDRVTVDVLSMPVGRARYSLLCNAEGGVIDDLLVTRLGEAKYLVVCNASNVEPVRAALEPGGACAVEWPETVMLAVQGPKSAEVLTSVGVTDHGPLKYYRACECRVEGTPAVISRGGYTGEDGYELILEPAVGVALADRLADAGAVPCGLGARDTLRLEAGMPLYGHELTEQIDPFTAGLDFAVRKGGETEAERRLETLRAADRGRLRVGLVFEGRRPVREGTRISAGGVEVGTVTSGTFSPTLQKPIAMALVKTTAAEPGTPVLAGVRGTDIPGEVVPLPFYRRPA